VIASKKAVTREAPSFYESASAVLSQMSSTTTTHSGDPERAMSRDEKWLHSCITLAALAVRYRDSSRQIITDDEWHTLRVASRMPLGEILQTYVKSATAIPLTAFHRILLVTWGWTELSVRSLSILSTLLTCLLLPRVLQRASLGPVVRVGAMVAFALSPFWIFYGQSSRPYAELLLLLLLTYAAALSCLTTRKAWPVVAFAVWGALAVYFHLFALPAIAATVFVALGTVVREWRTDGAKPARMVAARMLAMYGGWTLLVIALYWLPVKHGMVAELPPPEEKRLDATSAVQLTELLSGARYTWLGAVFIAFGVAGLVGLRKQARTFLAIVYAGAAGGLLFTLVSHPVGYSIALVFLRYNVTLHLLYFIGLGGALELALEWLHRVPRLARASSRFVAAGAVAALVVLLFAFSPIPVEMALRPCNFWMHAAYQQQYSGWDFSKPFVSTYNGPTLEQESPPSRFYTELGRRRPLAPCRVAEYPLQYADHKNPFYFFQRVDRCEAFGGYSSRTGIGRYIFPHDEPKGFRFGQLVNVEDLEALRSRQIDYVVVHLNHRTTGEDGNSGIPRETRHVLARLKKAFGEPVATDERIEVFATSSDAKHNAFRLPPMP